MLKIMLKMIVSSIVSILDRVPSKTVVFRNGLTRYVLVVKRFQKLREDFSLKLNKKIM